jgi:hypothetical protein
VKFSQEIRMALTPKDGLDIEEACVAYIELKIS